MSPLEGVQAGAASLDEEVRVRRGLPWKPLVAIVIIAGLGFIAYRSLGAKGPDKVAADYLDAKYNGRVTLAQQVTSADTASAPLLPRLLQVGAYTLTEAPPQFMGDRAEVPASVSFRLDLADMKDAKLASVAAAAWKELKAPIPTRIILVKQGGKWKVDQAATGRQFLQDAQRRFQGDKAWVADIFRGQPLTALKPGTVVSAVGPAGPPAPPGAKGARRGPPGAPPGPPGSPPARQAKPGTE